MLRSIQEHLLSQNTLVSVARSLSIPELIQTKVSIEGLTGTFGIFTDSWTFVVDNK